MTSPSQRTLQGLYCQELKGLCAANDRVQRFLRAIGHRVSDRALRELLGKSEVEIVHHTDMLDMMINARGRPVARGPCRGIDGLIGEALQQILGTALASGDVLDAAIIGHCQRLLHHGLAGLGIAAAYARALGHDKDDRRLRSAMGEIHQRDRCMSELAETVINRRAGASTVC